MAVFRSDGLPMPANPAQRPQSGLDRLALDISRQEQFYHGDPLNVFDEEGFASFIPPTYDDSFGATLVARGLWRGKEHPGGMSSESSYIGDLALALASGQPAPSRLRALPFAGLIVSSKVRGNLIKADPTFDAEKAWEDFSEAFPHQVAVLMFHGWEPQQAKDAQNHEAFFMATHGALWHIQNTQRIDDYQERAGTFASIAAPVVSGLQSYFLLDPDTVNIPVLGGLVGGGIRGVRGGVQAARAAQAAPAATAARQPLTLTQRRLAAEGVDTTGRQVAQGGSALGAAASAAFRPAAEQTIHGQLAARLGTTGAFSTEVVAQGAIGVGLAFKEHHDHLRLMEGMYGNLNYARPLTAGEVAMYGGSNVGLLLGLRGTSVALSGAWRGTKKLTDTFSDQIGLHRKDPIRMDGLSSDTVATSAAEANGRVTTTRLMRELTPDGDEAPMWAVHPEVLAQAGADIHQVQRVISEVHNAAEGLPSREARNLMEHAVLELFEDTMAKKAMSGVSPTQSRRVIQEEGLARRRELDVAEDPTTVVPKDTHRVDADNTMREFGHDRVERYPLETDSEHLSLQMARDTFSPEGTPDGRLAKAGFQRRQILETEGGDGTMVQVDVPIDRFSTDPDADGFRFWRVADDEVDSSVVGQYVQQDGLEAPPGYIGRDADTGEMVIVDGRHRIRAAMERGDQSVRTYMSETSAEAMGFARSRPRHGDPDVDWAIRNGEQPPAPEPIGPLTREQALEQALRQAIDEKITLSRRIRAMRREAEVDPLTGILSRRGLQRRADRLMARADSQNVPVSVVTGDLSQFKALNDVLGHADGDVALKNIGRVLREEARSANQQRGRAEGDAVGIAARDGGDEFVVVLYNTTEEASQAFINRVRDRIRRELADIGLDRIVTKRGERRINFEGEAVTRQPNDPRPFQQIKDEADLRLTERRAREKAEGRPGEVMTRFDDPTEVAGIVQPRKAYLDGTVEIPARTTETPLMRRLAKLREETDVINDLQSRLAETPDDADLLRQLRNARRRRNTAQRHLNEEYPDTATETRPVEEIRAEIGDGRDMNHNGRVSANARIFRESDWFGEANDAIRDFTLLSKLVNAVLDNRVTRRLIGDRTGREALRSSNRAIQTLVRILDADMDWRVGSLLGNNMVNTVGMNNKVGERVQSQAFARFQTHAKFIRANGGMSKIGAGLIQHIREGTTPDRREMREMLDAFTDFMEFYRKEGIKAGVLRPETTLADMPLFLDHAAVRADFDQATTALGRKWAADFQEGGARRGEIHNETAELLGWKRRVVDPQTGETSRWELTDTGREALRHQETPVDRAATAERLGIKEDGKEMTIIAEGSQQDLGGLITEARATANSLREQPPRPGREARHQQEIQKFVDREAVLQEAYRGRFGEDFVPADQQAGAVVQPVDAARREVAEAMDSPDQLPEASRRIYDDALVNLRDAKGRTAIERGAAEYMQTRLRMDRMIEGVDRNAQGQRIALSEMRGYQRRQREDVRLQRRLEGDVFDDPDMAKFFVTDPLEIMTTYTQSRGKYILNQKSLEELTFKGNTWDAFFDAVEVEAKRLTQTPDETVRIEAMMDTLREKHMLMTGVLPEMKSGSDIVTTQAMKVAGYVTRILYGAWVGLNATVELQWAMLSNITRPAQFVNDQITGLKASGLLGERLRQQTLQDVFHGTGYAARVAQADMSSRFMHGDPSLSNNFSPFGRVLKPYKQLWNLIRNKSNPFPDDPRWAQIMNATGDALQDTTMRMGLTNYVTELAAVIRVHQSRRQFARQLDNLQRLETLHRQTDFNELYNTTLRRELDRGLSQDRAQARAARAVGAEEVRLAKQAGVEWDFAIAVREARLLEDAQFLAILREAGENTGAWSRNTHNADYSAELAYGYMSQITTDRANLLQDALNRYQHMVENLAKRRVSEGSPFNTPTSPFSRTASGKLLHTFANYMGHFFDNNVLAVNRMPGQNWLAAMGAYMFLDGVLFMNIRRLLRGEDPDAIAEEIRENPAGFIARASTRVPFFGRAAWIPDAAISAVGGNLNAGGVTPASAATNIALGAVSQFWNDMVGITTGEGEGIRWTTQQQRLVMGMIPAVNTWYGHAALAHLIGAGSPEESRSEATRQRREPITRGTPNWLNYNDEQLTEQLDILRNPQILHENRTEYPSLSELLRPPSEEEEDSALRSIIRATR